MPTHKVLRPFRVATDKSIYGVMLNEGDEYEFTAETAGSLVKEGYIAALKAKPGRPIGGTKGAQEEATLALTSGATEGVAE